jgi:hypothetical protein
MTILWERGYNSALQMKKLKVREATVALMALSGRARP